MQIPNWVLFHPDLSDGAKVTWMTLATYADNEHEAFPGIKALSAGRLVEDRTIQRHLTVLELVGALARIAYYRDDGGRSSNTYVLAWADPFRDGWADSLGPITPGDPDVTTPGDSDTTGTGDAGVTPITRSITEQEPNDEKGQETSAQSADGPQETTMKNYREPNLDELTPVDEPLVQEGKAPPRAKSPAGQLADFFYSEWTRVREHPRHVNLVSPGQRQIVVNRLKYIMETEKIDAVRLRSMIEHFYKRVEAGQVVLKSENLVFAFMADRARLYPQSAKPAARRGLDGFKHKITL